MQENLLTSALVVGKKLDITNPVAEFKRQCTESPLYNHELNSLRTVHTRR
jgi:hypothetical protein